MRWLILSDLHSNLHALEAVIADTAGLYDQVVCLGDIVGYGADPNAVTAWVRDNSQFTIRGNHDRASAGDPVIETFSDNAADAVRWTRRKLTAQNSAWLRELPSGPLAVGRFFIVHGSPRHEDEYLFNRDEVVGAFRVIPGDVCFFGHTHCQLGFAWRRGRLWLLYPPEEDESDLVHALDPDAGFLLNPGSTGQPRDGDPRAACAIYDDESRQVSFRRVRYDVAGAQMRILETGLPDSLAARLYVGR